MLLVYVTKEQKTENIKETKKNCIWTNIRFWEHVLLFKLR